MRVAAGPTAKTARTPKGTTLSYSLTEPAALTVTGNTSKTSTARFTIAAR